MLVLQNALADAHDDIKFLHFGTTPGAVDQL
jgi:hypothetical protein